jgi:hypothetical protein
MPAFLKVGLLLLAVGTYFGGAYLHGEKTGQAVQLRKHSDRPGPRRDQEPARFAVAQRTARHWSLALLTLGGVCTAIGVVQKIREGSA